MRGIHGLGAVLVAALVLGGCLGGVEDPSGGEGGEKATPTDSTGSVEGRILTENMEPVQDANVLLVLGADLIAEKKSDAMGYFVMNNVEPGYYRLQVTHICCKQHVAGIQVTEGETTTASAMLPVIPTRDPFVRDYVWNGHVSCSARIPFYGINPQCGALDPNQDRVHQFEVHKGLKSFVMTMEWDPVLTNAQDQLTIIFYKDTNPNRNRYFWAEGPSPIVRHIGPEDPSEDLQFENIEDTWTMRFTVLAGGVPNVVYQQPFTVYYDLYYWEEAPEDARAGPG